MKKWLSLMVALLASSGASGQEEVRVYAASSLTNAISAIIAIYPVPEGVKITPVYGGSSSLARQLANGAPGDIFISANTKWMDYLSQEQRISRDDVTNLLGNQLVVITHKDNDVTLDLHSAEQWQQLLRDERLAMGDANSVPAGMYARQMFENLHLWSQIEKRVAPSKNVRLALALVERREALLGVVYQTDALLSEKVKVVNTPDPALYEPIIYPAGLLSDSKQANAFYQFLFDDEAKAIFSRFGFVSLEQP
ncbi:molybdate ABC transporter substrate-binding protein [Vibrio cidicii]